jgi:hypothetical protein
MLVTRKQMFGEEEKAIAQKMSSSSLKLANFPIPLTVTQLRLADILRLL